MLSPVPDLSVNLELSNNLWFELIPGGFSQPSSGCSGSIIGISYIHSLSTEEDPHWDLALVGLQILIYNSKCDGETPITLSAPIQHSSARQNASKILSVWIHSKNHIQNRCPYNEKSCQDKNWNGTECYFLFPPILPSCSIYTPEEWRNIKYIHTIYI